jgi:hypothetical protein
MRRSLQPANSLVVGNERLSDVATLTELFGVSMVLEHENNCNRQTLMASVRLNDKVFIFLLFVFSRIDSETAAFLPRKLMSPE